MSTIWGAGWVGRESYPGGKRILKPTIPGSQGQAPSNPTHSVLVRKARTCIKLGQLAIFSCRCRMLALFEFKASPLWSPNQWVGWSVDEAHLTINFSLSNTHMLPECGVDPVGRSTCATSSRQPMGGSLDWGSQWFPRSEWSYRPKDLLFLFSTLLGLLTWGDAGGNGNGLAGGLH